MSRKILEHFRKVDPVLAKAAEKVWPVAPRKSTDYFTDVCETIISQQLSDKVARVIMERFENLFPRKLITPDRVIKMTPEKLRGAGMSGSKVKFIKGLAEAIKKGEVDVEKLKELPDDEVARELIKLPGIGPWTAEMFLMFSLGREDVFSYGDLGLRRAIKRLYGFKTDPSRKQIEKIVNKWSPYRTYASLVLWKAVD